MLKTTLHNFYYSPMKKLLINHKIVFSFSFAACSKRTTVSFPHHHTVCRHSRCHNHQPEGTSHGHRWSQSAACCWPIAGDPGAISCDITISDKSPPSWAHRASAPSRESRRTSSKRFSTSVGDGSFPSCIFFLCFVSNTHTESGPMPEQEAKWKLIVKKSVWERDTGGKTEADVNKSNTATSVPSERY